VRGGAPGTRETDLLNPVNLVDKAHAIYLSGGSAFGLDGATGVMKYLEEKGIGLDVVLTKVPIVPGAVLFDLGVGDYRIRPDARMGYDACLNASEEGGQAREYWSRDRGNSREDIWWTSLYEEWFRYCQF